MNKEVINEEPTLKGNPRKRFYKRLAGKRYGYIEVIEKVGKQGNNVLWKCFCHACNKEAFLIAPLLNSRRKSCGCRKTMRECTSPYWQGVGEISRTILTGIKQNAKRRKIHYEVSDEYLWELFLKQNRMCALSGLSLMFGRTNRVNVTASLDRIDSSKGYIEGNLQWLHKHVNLMKLNHSDEYFIELCKLVANHNI